MKNFRKGTPLFGVFLGAVFMIFGGLIMWLGFWRTLCLIALFALGYFLGAVNDKSGLVKSAVGKVVPEKKEKTIDFRKEIQQEQEARYAQMMEESAGKAGTAAADAEKSEEVKG